MICETDELGIMPVVVLTAWGIHLARDTLEDEHASEEVGGLVQKTD